MKLNIVPARTGITWVKLGIQTFLKQPLALTGLFFLYMAMAVLTSLIPFIGAILAVAIWPAAILGLMAATLEATKGRFPMPTILISAFRAGKQRARAMLILGFLYAAACLLIVSVVPLFFNVPVNPQSALAPEMRGMMLTMILVSLPVSVLFWLAAALVHWHGITPVKSLFFSAVVCFRNAGAYLLFGITWIGVALIVLVVISLIAALLGDPQTAGTLLMPAFLLLTTMFATSIYFTFRDSFEASPEIINDNTPTRGDEP